MSGDEVPDALPAEPFPEGPEREPEGDEPESPYRNLLVPLLVVPALIVLVMALIVVLFLGIVGEEASPADNLERMIHGGSNERTQAATLLVTQVLEHVMAEREGREPQWEIDATFLPDVRRAWDETDEDDVQARYVLSTIQVHLGDREGLARLTSLLSLRDELDPKAEMRFRTLYFLGAKGPDLDAEARPAAAAAVIPFLDHEDRGLRTMAAVALQTLPSPSTVPALRETLRDGVLAVRGNAALALTHHGDDAGVEVLHELVDPASYEEERAQDPTLWTRAEDVSQSRRKAVAALARLGRDEDLPRLRTIADEDPDLNVREVALRALKDREG